MRQQPLRRGPRDPWPVSASTGLYAALVCAYPPRFRRRYDTEMVQVFRTACRTAHAGHGVWGVVRLWLPTALDLVRSLLAEQWAANLELGGTMMQWILDRHHPARRAGLLCGLAFGAVHAAYALINNLNDLDAAGGRLLNNALLVSLVVLFGVAGWRGARSTGRLSTGVRASLLTWGLSTAIGLAALWVVTFAAMDTIARNTGMQHDFVRSGARDMRTFIVEDALGATVVGSVAALVAGTAAGTLGALLTRVRPRILARA